MKKLLYRFFLINQDGMFIVDKHLDKKAIFTREEEDTLISHVFNDPDIHLIDNTTIFSRDLEGGSFTRLYYQKVEGDLYVLIADELADITNVVSTFEQWANEREKQRNQLKGIVYTIFTDIEGPSVIYNNSTLDDDQALLLAVQGQTVSSMGRHNSFVSGFKEPLVVPRREDLMQLSYDFLQPAPDSDDPRIKKMGRISNIYLLFDREFPYVKQQLFREYVSGVLDDWVITHFETPQDTQKQREEHSQRIFGELLEDLRSTISIAIDMVTHEEREVAKFRQLFFDLMTENKLLNYQVRRLKERLKELEDKNTN